MVRVIWEEEALDDFEQQILFVAKENPQAAFKLHARVEAVSAHLGTSPYFGKHGRREDTRELVVTGTPYVLVYTYWQDDVYVLRVFHTAQDRD